MQLQPNQICAHRGASGTAPENTMAAFRLACDMAVGSIEFDISLLGDGHLIIHHDAVLGRTIRATGMLSKMTFTAFHDLDAGSWFDDRFAGERAPFLGQVLRLLDAHSKMAILDVKIHANEEEEFAVALAKELSQNNAPSPLITSFSRSFLCAMRHECPNARLGLLDEPLPPDWEAFCDEWKMEAVHLDYTQSSTEDIAAIRASGRDIRLYTANEPAGVAPHLAAGATAIITDFPERFIPKG